jgi:two-component system, NarL family, invasion response regulator UvrY
MIRVLIADDHPIVRQGLRQILAETGDIEVKAEASAGQEVLEKIRRHPVDAVVLDLSMPGTSGLDTLKQIKEERPRLPVLVLSIHPEDQYAVRALRAGASGYLTKSSAPEALVTAIRKLAGGGRFITPSLGEKLAESLQNPLDGKPLHETLSDREFEVFRLIAKGKTVGEAAQILFISPKTVSTYRHRILEKTGLKTTAELMRYAVDHGVSE